MDDHPLVRHRVPDRLGLQGIVIRLVTGASWVGLSAATLRASAGTAPFGRSSFETAPVDLGVLAVSGGTAEASSGIVDGNVRESVGTVEIGRVDIGGGVFVLEGLRAKYNSTGCAGTM